MPKRRMRMPYCLSCGKLRKTYGGFCAECKLDEDVKRTPEKKAERLRRKREHDRAAREAAFLMPEKGMMALLRKQ